MWGLDAPGLCKFPIIGVSELPTGHALATFTKTFGNSLPTIETAIQTDKPPRIRPGLLWDDNHKYDDKFDEIEHEAKRIKPLIQEYPYIDWRVAGAIEHRLNKDKANKLKDMVLSILPMVTYVNCPLRKQGGELIRTGPKVVNEIHKGDGPPPTGRYDFSYDGANCVDSDVTADKKIWAGAETFYWWNCQCNGRKVLNDPTPRPNRNAWPTRKDIRSWVALEQTRGRVSLPPNWLYKSHADRHDTPPGPRDCKPVWIVPVRTQSIKLVASNGKLISTAKYYGTYDEKPPEPIQRYRYYHSLYGYELAEQAVKVSGSPICNVVVNDKVVGKINPAFRTGSFR